MNTYIQLSIMIMAFCNISTTITRSIMLFAIVWINTNPYWMSPNAYNLQFYWFQRKWNMTTSNSFDEFMKSNKITTTTFYRFEISDTVTSANSQFDTHQIISLFNNSLTCNKQICCQNSCGFRLLGFVSKWEAVCSDAGPNLNIILI